MVLAAGSRQAIVHTCRGLWACVGSKSSKNAGIHLKLCQWKVLVKGLGSGVLAKKRDVTQQSTDHSFRRIPAFFLLSQLINTT